MYPHERSLVQRLKDMPFALIGVNSDSKERVTSAMERENITWRSFWDGGRTGGPIASAWGVRSWPTIYVIDDLGVIRYKNVRGEAMDKAVDELLERSITILNQNIASDDPQVRGLAAFRMGKYHVPDCKEKLQQLIDDGDETVRQRAATGLALLGESADTLLPLVRKAIADVDPSVREGGLQVVAKAKDGQAADLVIAAIGDDESSVRQAAIDAISVLKAPGAAKALANAVDDPNRSIAKSAALTLALIESDEATELLKQLGERGDHPLRVWIAAALHRREASGTTERFQALLEDSDTAIRRQAVAALDELEGFDATDLQIAALADQDAEVRRIVRNALSGNENPRAVEALTKHLTAEIEELVPQLADARKRTAALRELQQLGPAAAPLLLEQLDKDQSRPGESSLIYGYLARAIGTLGNTSIIPRVVDVLKDADAPATRRYAMESILRSMAEDARAEIEALAADEDSVARGSGIRILATSTDEAARRILKQALQDDVPSIGVTAAAALARTKDPDALTVLLDASKSDDVQVRQSGVYALANYAPEQVVPALTTLAQDADSSVRYSAVTALGRFKTKAATEAIAKALEKNPSLASMVMSALRNQDTPDAAKALVAIYKRSSGTDRQRAESYLKRMRTPEAQRLLAEAIAEVQKASAGAPPTLANQNPLGLLNGWGYLIDPDKDSVFTIARDAVGIKVPGTPHDLSAELNRMNAPRILQSVTGDFAIELRVSGQFGAGESTIQERAAYNGAGVLLMSDMRNYVRLERAVLVRGGQRRHYANFEIRVNGRNVRFGQPDDFVIDDTKDCFLRLERAGNEIRGAIRQDAAADWHYLRSKPATWNPQAAVGVCVVNSSDKPFAATFSDVLLKQGTPAVTAERTDGD